MCFREGPHKDIGQLVKYVISGLDNQKIVQDCFNINCRGYYSKHPIQII